MTTPRAPHAFVWPLNTQPRVRLAGRFPMDVCNFEALYLSRTHALHLHEYHGAVEILGRRYDLRPGDITFSPAGRVSSYGLRESGHHYCIHFHPPEDASGRSVNLPMHLRLGTHHEQAVLKFMAIAQMVQTQPRARELARAAAGASLQQLILWLALIARQRHGQSISSAQHLRSRVDAGVQQAADWLAAHLDQPFDMDALLAEVGFSQNYLAKHFRQRYGVTIPQYLLQLRMQVAHYLLESTNLSIKTIGVRAGMPDPQYFNKQFRRWAGCSPSAMRATSGTGLPALTPRD